MEPGPSDPPFLATKLVHTLVVRIHKWQIDVYKRQAQQSDVEARAMKDEMQRSMKDLHLESTDGPYFIAYKIVDSERKEAHASFGSLTSSGEARSRVLSVTVRVGSYEFDNTNRSGAGGLGAIEVLLLSLIHIFYPHCPTVPKSRRRRL